MEYQRGKKHDVSYSAGLTDVGALFGKLCAVRIAKIKKLCIEHRSSLMNCRLNLDRLRH